VIGPRVGPFTPLGTADVRNINGKCAGFAWIGQSFKWCDNCSLPYWEHSYAMTLRDGRWFRQLISKELAAAVKRKWDH
jgi:hypothetical protein